MSIDEIRERWADPLLTGLTALVMIMMFVISPLQALGIFAFQASELVLALLLVAGIFVISGSPVAVVAMLIALGMITAGAILRIKSPSLLDLNLFAGSWLIVGATMAWAVARATFAPGRITYHRVIGAVLLYMTIAVIFSALYTFMGSLVPNAFAGMKVEDSPALASQADDDRLWRRRARASDRAQPVQHRGGVRPALSGDAAGTAGHAGDRAPRSGLLKKPPPNKNVENNPMHSRGRADGKRPVDAQNHLTRRDKSAASRAWQPGPVE